MKTTSRTGDPDDAAPGPGLPDGPRCVRCGKLVPGAREKYTLCEPCKTDDQEAAVQRQLDIAAGKIPKRRYWKDGKLVAVYEGQPPQKGE